MEHTLFHMGMFSALLVSSQQEVFSFLMKWGVLLAKRKNCPLVIRIGGQQNSQAAFSFVGLCFRAEVNRTRQKAGMCFQVSVWKKALHILRKKSCLDEHVLLLEIQLVYDFIARMVSPEIMTSKPFKMG